MIESASSTAGSAALKRAMLVNKGQSHLAAGSIVANVLFGGKGSRVGSAMVPLDRALLSSYWLSVVTIPLSVTVWTEFAMQILTAGSDPHSPIRSPKSPLPVGDRGPSLIKCCLGQLRVSLLNGISLRYFMTPHQ